MHTCPFCRQQVEKLNVEITYVEANVFFYHHHRLKCGDIETALLAVLHKGFPSTHPIYTSDLIYRIYEGAGIPEPDYAYQTICRIVNRLNKKLAKINLHISRPMTGYLQLVYYKDRKTSHAIRPTEKAHPSQHSEDVYPG